MKFNKQSLKMFNKLQNQNILLHFVIYQQNPAKANKNFTAYVKDKNEIPIVLH